MTSRFSTWLGGARWSNRGGSPKMDQEGSLAGNPSRFEGEGLLFRAKLIGRQAVPDGHGYRVCQDAMAKLKAAVRASRQHKRRVHLSLSLQGIRIRDEKSGELLFHHPVQQIMFISRDTGDARAIGYIYMAQDRSFHYIAIKTERAAAELGMALVGLFQVVLEILQQGRQLPGDVQEAISSPPDVGSAEPPVPETIPAVEGLLE
ncbi:disabled homolog 1-like [Amblyomma americanum]